MLSLGRAAASRLRRGVRQPALTVMRLRGQHTLNTSLHMHPLTTTSTRAVALYDQAVTEYISLSGSPGERLEAAVAADPDFLMGHALLGMLYALSTGVTADNDVVARCLVHTSRLYAAGRGTPRERAFAIAFHAWACGRTRAAAAILEASLQEHPTDIVTIRAAHDTHFFNGDRENLRLSLCRVYREWEASMPGFDKLNGMMAFGFEESHLYSEAEEYGMSALNMDPADPWALHAVVHCHEMTSRVNEGKRLLNEMRPHWEEEGPTRATLLEHHLHWHFALFEAEEGLHTNALSKYDNQMAAGRDVDTVLALADAAALLWRLELGRRPLLHGSILRPAYPSAPVSREYLRYVGSPVDSATGGGWTPPGAAAGGVPTRWTELARRFRPFVGQCVMPFNDVHCAMALAAAGDRAALADHLAAMRSHAAGLAVAATVDGKSTWDGTPWQPSAHLQAYFADADVAFGRVVSAAVTHRPIAGFAPPGKYAAGAVPEALTHPLKVTDADGDEDPAGVAAGSGGGGSGGKARPGGSAVDATTDSGGGLLSSLFQSFGLRGDSGRAGTAVGSTAAAAPAAMPPAASRSAAPAATSTSGFEAGFALQPAVATAEATVLDSPAQRMMSRLPTAAWSRLEGTDLLRHPDGAVVTAMAGLDMAEGMAAFWRGDMGDSAARLARSRPHWHRVGGSHAQRDVFAQTLLHAATEAGMLHLARSLAAERVATRPANAQAWILYAGVQELMGDGGKGIDARNRAYALGLGQGGPSY